MNARSAFFIYERAKDLVGKLLSDKAAKEVAKEVAEDVAKEAAEEIVKQAIKPNAPSTSNKWDNAAYNKLIESGAPKIDSIIKRVLLLRSPSEVKEGEGSFLQEPPLVTNRSVEDEFATLQREWMAITLAKAAETQFEASTTMSRHSSNWRWLLLGGVVVLVIGGSLYVWYHRRRGGNGGRGAGGGAAPGPGGGGGGGAGVRGGPAGGNGQDAASSIGLQVLLHPGRGGGSGRLVWRGVFLGSANMAAAATSNPIVASADPAPRAGPGSSFAEIYKVEPEGDYHHPKFRCTVEVGGQQFASTVSFNRNKEAEQDAARVAYENLATIGEGDVNEVFGLIDQDTVFCKSILHEFAVKTKTTWPSYSVVRLDKPVSVFVASVVFDGNTYTGESACNKKDAEQNAARTAIKSILGRPEHAAPASQDESSSLGVQGHSIVPAAGTSTNISAKAVTGSKKRKGRAGGPVVNETVVVKEH